MEVVNQVKPGRRLSSDSDADRKDAHNVTDSVPVSPSQANKVFQKVVDEELQKDAPDFDRISQYLDFDVSLLYVDEYQATVLHRAAFAGRAEIAALALKQKADVNAANTMGRTALHCAAENCAVECVRLFIGADAEVNAETLGGMTALHLAVRAKATGAVQALLEHKDILVDIENNERQTPLMLCRDPEIAKLIEDRKEQDLKR